MKSSILFFFVAFSSITQAQVTLQVSDQESKENIEFASILLPDYQKSFVADEKGKFVVDTEQYKLPLKVIAEQFGFQQKEITLQNTTKIYNISLTPSSEILREIIIPPANAKIKERTFGITNESTGKFKGEDSTHNYNQNSMDTDYEFGMIINTKEKFIKVKKVHWHINGFTYKRAFFSVYFYEVANGKPTKRIPHENINFILTNKNIGWNKINVENLDIYISSHKKIAVVLKQQKVEFEKGKSEGAFFQNIGLTMGNTFVTRTSYYNEWLTLPASFPFYITVDSYE
ncbi:CarboxypepD_reg-like domain-containing protein [Paenimyroides aquimaris]|uniref:CarboxypepD_reg-like domain-containing protein n=1 Tax=Paenimyroides marinum TaxID=1159016 RepID=A0A1H6KTN7_9FLAO|nr:carboxypeptidase-like regulatory domain-containing protein [Paenimyroides aquimaris]SEH79056.1 CarboxypepD_reg-like domain-containing protein [Paenimyroides aquimaris]